MSLYGEEVTAVLGEGSEFEGRLLFEGVARIDGKFVGEIFSKNTLILGAGSHVKAQVEADIVIVSGEFEGTIVAQNKVEILSSAHVRGEIYSPIFKIEEGGVFDGQTKMLEKNV